MKIKEIKQDKIIFDNGYVLEYYHDQDCCERVYAEFEAIKNYNVSTKTGKMINLKEIEFCEIFDELIEGIKKMGFNLVSKIGEKFFVPCYNEQYGYYSSDLTLILNKGNQKEEKDITDFVKYVEK